MEADLFCCKLFLHQLRNHSVLIRHPWQRHINIFHVFGLENILHPYRGKEIILICVVVLGEFWSPTACFFKKLYYYFLTCLQLQ